MADEMINQFTDYLKNSGNANMRSTHMRQITSVGNGDRYYKFFSACSTRPNLIKPSIFIQDWNKGIHV